MSFPNDEITITTDEIESVVDRQVDVHHQLQDQAFRLLRLFATITGVFVAGISLVISNSVSIGHPSRNYQSLTQIYGTSASNIEFAVGMQLVIFVIFSVISLGFVISTVSDSFSNLSAIYLYPGLGQKVTVNIIDRKRVRKEMENQEKWLQHNTDLLNRDAENLSKTYQKLLITIFSGGFSAVFFMFWFERSIFLTIYLGVAIMAALIIILLGYSYRFYQEIATYKKWPTIIRDISFDRENLEDYLIIINDRLEMALPIMLIFVILMSLGVFLSLLIVAIYG